VPKIILEKILVYVDLDKSDDFSIQHGVEIGLFSKKELNLLHIVDNKNPNSLFLEKAQTLMKEMVNTISANFPIKVNGYVLEGNKFKLINSVADRIGAAIVVFEMNEFQKLDKQTLKLINSSRVPYIIVKQKMLERSYKNIVFPIDPSVETKEKVLWAIFFSVHYNTVIHILYAKNPDKPIDPELHKNLIYTRKTFNNFDVNFRIHELEGSCWDIHKMSLDFAHKTEAGLIIIMMTKHYGLFDYILGPHEKKFMDTNTIPVMCINSREDLYVPCI